MADAAPGVAVQPPRSAAESAWYKHVMRLQTHNKAVIREYCDQKPASWRSTLRTMLHALMVLDGVRHPALGVMEAQGVLRHHLSTPAQDAKTAFCTTVADAAKQSRPFGPDLKANPNDHVKEFVATEWSISQHCRAGSNPLELLGISVLPALITTQIRNQRLANHHRHNDLTEQAATLATYLSEVENVFRAIELEHEKMALCGRLVLDVSHRAQPGPAPVDLRSFGLAAEDAPSARREQPAHHAGR